MRNIYDKFKGLGFGHISSLSSMNNLSVGAEEGLAHFEVADFIFEAVISLAPSVGLSQLAAQRCELPH